MTSTINRRALKALRTVCAQWVEEKNFQSITLSALFTSLRIEILKIDFETGDWKLCGISGNGVVSLAACLSGITEKEAEKKIVVMLPKESIIDAEQRVMP